MVNTLLLDNKTVPALSISQEQYLQWAGKYLFDALQNQRPGQSFCNHFEIQDNILYFCDNAKTAHRYIQKNYVKCQQQTQ